MKDAPALPADSGLPQCLRRPIPEIQWAARVLRQAMQAHVRGERELAAPLIVSTDTREIRAWVESLWGKRSPYVRPMEGAVVPRLLDPLERVPDRMPDREGKRALIQAQGLHCRFCGVPLIRAETRERLRRWYPDALPWGRTNASQHAAFQAMWLQFDHLVPHSYGGNNALSNIVITCAPCNFARMERPIELLGLTDPRDRPPVVSDWDGLEPLVWIQ